MDRSLGRDWLPWSITSVDSDLLPGDVGFWTIPGRVGGLVSLGQSLLRDECWLTHAFIVVRDGPKGTPLQAVEAMPSGARLANITSRLGGGYAYVRLPLSEEQRSQVTTVALSLVGTPYSFADYLALALWEWRVPLASRLVRGYVSRSSRMICSQLVDYVLCKIGFHLFTDGRLPQDVTPGQLFRQAGAIGCAAWWPAAGPAVSSRPDSPWGSAVHPGHD